MAQNHEDPVVELHSALQQRSALGGGTTTTDGIAGPADMTGAQLPAIAHEKGDRLDAEHQHAHSPDEAEPTEHEKKTLRHIGDQFPASAFLIAIVELCERFTCMPSQASCPTDAVLTRNSRLRLSGSIPELH